MSPQQRAGRSPAPSDDVYALGVLLYELLVGALPYELASYRGWASVAANVEGGLSERARRRAAELANDADLRIRAPRDPVKLGSAAKRFWCLRKNSTIAGC